MGSRIPPVLLAILLLASGCTPRVQPEAESLPAIAEAAQPSPSADSTAEAPAQAPAMRTATGSRQGVFYEVFVRAFADGDGDGIGDLTGLTEKLDYLNDGRDETTDDLGVTGLWLMPIHPSPSYHGYDVTDYRDIHPDYGTLEDFRALLDAAHTRGISVIIDLVLNHTSSAHPWFVQSAARKEPYRNWYRWAEPEEDAYSLSAAVWGHPVWIPRNGSLYYAIFWDGMPDLNYDEPAVRQEMKDVASFWLDMGVDGFRLDAVPHVYGTAELPDNGTGLTPTRAWWAEFQAHCRSVNPEVLLVGEVLDRLEVRLPYADLFDSVFQVDFGETVATAVKGGGSRNDHLALTLEQDLARYRAVNPDFLNTPILSNHDQNRIFGLVGGKVDNMKLAASMVLLSEGLPFLYYGEELGMFGSKPDEDIRLPFVWGDDDAQTTWRTSRYTKVVDAASQLADPDSLHAHYRRVIALRTAHPALHAGKLSAVKAGNPAVVAWRLDTAGQIPPSQTVHSDAKKDHSALVLFNLSTEPVDLTLSALGLSREPWKLAFTQHTDTAGLSEGLPVPADTPIHLHPKTTLVFIHDDTPANAGGKP